MGDLFLHRGRFGFDGKYFREHADKIRQALDGGLVVHVEVYLDRDHVEFTVLHWDLPPIKQGYVTPEYVVECEWLEDDILVSREFISLGLKQ